MKKTSATVRCYRHVLGATPAQCPPCVHDRQLPQRCPSTAAAASPEAASRNSMVSATLLSCYWYIVMTRHGVVATLLLQLECTTWLCLCACALTSSVALIHVAAAAGLEDFVHCTKAADAARVRTGSGLQNTQTLYILSTGRHARLLHQRSAARAHVWSEQPTRVVLGEPQRQTCATGARTCCS